MLLDLIHRARRRQQRLQQSYNLGLQANASWHDRAQCAARLSLCALQQLPPLRAISVADIGCGDQKLKALLLYAHANRLLYDGFDIRPQSSDVVALDITSADLPRKYDLAFMLGVLEYVDEPIKVVDRVLTAANVLCVSMTLKDRLKASADGRQGWRYLPTLDQWRSTVVNAGYVVQQMELVDDGQVAVSIVTR